MCKGIRIVRGTQLGFHQYESDCGFEARENCEPSGIHTYVLLKGGFWGKVWGRAWR